jgi:hypothetical protein
MTFIFGVIIAALVFFFSNEIQEIMVSTGLRDYIVSWLQSW